MRLLRANEDKAKSIKSSLMRASTIGLSVLMFTSFFTTGCELNAKDRDLGNTEIIEEITNPSVEYTQEVLDYLDANIKSVLVDATKLDMGLAYSNLKLTQYDLQGLTVYETETGDFCVLSGDQRIPLILNDDGSVILSSGITRYNNESHRTYMDFYVGNAKEEYNQKVYETEALDRENLEHAVLVANGVAFEDYVGTNRMVKEIDEHYYINLGRLADYLGFEYADSETGDVVEENTLEDNKLLESITLNGYDDEVQYTFIKDTNKVVLLTRGIVESLQTEADAEAESTPVNTDKFSEDYVDPVAEKTEETAEQTDEAELVTDEDEQDTNTADYIIKNFIENNEVTKYLNVGEEETIFADGILWIPVEYLSTAFGLDYEVDGQVITLTGGHILPKVILLDCTDSAGLEEVIAERKAEAERIEAERKAKEEAERKAMEAAQRAEAERKAAEAEAARRADEEEARRNSASGSHKAEEPTPTAPAPSGGSGQPSSAFGGIGFGSGGDLSFGGGNGSIDFN